MRINRSRFIVSVGAVAALSVAAGAWMGPGQDVQGGNGIDTDSQSGGAGSRASFHRFTIPFALSETDSIFTPSDETVVKVINDSDEVVDVTVEWVDSGGFVQGTSGPVTINPHQSNLLSTLNAGEDAMPFYQSTGFRDTTHDLACPGKVFVGPNSNSAKNVTVQAMFLADMTLGQVGSYGSNARTVTELHVHRATDADGDGSSDTVFKGD